MEEVEKYIPENHIPHASPIGELYIGAMEDLAFPSPSTKISRFEEFSRITGGFRPREFSIVCGSTGTGKTTLMANWSASLVEDRIPHFVASVETGHTDFIKRIISVLNGEDWNTGDSVPVDKLRKFDSSHSGKFSGDSLFLSLYDNRFSVETLMADIAWHVKHKRIKMAIIDNLNFFMEVTRASDQIVEMDRVIHELIIFCKRVDVHVVMVMHPKKTQNGRVESEFDIKGSSTAVQEAHNVFLFNKPDQDMLATGKCQPGDRELKIAKMRRKGRAVGSRLVLISRQGVSYSEGATFQ